jgi:hypothetical protein
MPQTCDVQLHGGPLDGMTVPVDPDDPDPWTAVIADGCRYPGGRSMYAPAEDGRWVWVRDLPPEAM